MPERTAEALAASRRRRKAETEFAGKVKRVAAVLSKAEAMPVAVPAHIGEMLSKGLPSALATVQDQRHPMQSKVIDHAQELLSEAVLCSKRRLEKDEADMASQAGEARGIEATLQGLSAEMEVANKAVEDLKKRFSEQTEELKVAQKELKTAEAQAKANNKELTGYSKDAEKYRTMESGPFKVLTEGSCASEKEAKKLLTKLTKDVEKFGAESSILKGLPGALGRRPEKRKGNDEKVITGLRTLLRERAEALEASTAACKETATELSATVTRQQAAVEASKAKHEAVAEQLRAAEATRDAKDAARSAEKNSRKALEQRRKKLKENIDQLEESSKVLAHLAARTAADVEAAGKAPVIAQEAPKVPPQIKEVTESCAALAGA